MSKPRRLKVQLNYRDLNRSTVNQALPYTLRSDVAGPSRQRTPRKRDQTQELRNAEYTIQVLRNENENIIKHCNENQKENDNLKTSLKLKEEQNTVLQNENRELRSSLELQKDQYRELENKYEESRSALKLKEEQYSEVENHIEILRSSLELEQKRNAKLETCVKNKTSQLAKIRKQKNELSHDNKIKTATINDLEEEINSLNYEIEELKVKKKEQDTLLENTRQECTRLFNSKVDRTFAEKNTHLITEVHKLYDENSHLDKIQHCPAMAYMNSVQAPERDNEPPPKRRKTNDNIANISYTKESLKKLVMGLESRHSEQYDLWRNVLWALNSCGRENGYDTLDIANEFSKRSPKYKNIEDVKETFISSNGTVSLKYLIKISKIYEEDLQNMEEYLSTLVPSMLPLTLTQMDCRDPNKLKLTVECPDTSYELLIIPHLYVLTDHCGKKLEFLEKKITSSSSSLMPLGAEMSDGFIAKLNDDDYSFESKKHSKQLVWHYPLTADSCIVFKNDLRKKNSRDLQCIHKALRKETMKLLYRKSGKKIDIDGDYIVDIDNKNSDAIRAYPTLLNALYAAEPSMKTRYLYSENTIYHCDPERNVWNYISRKKFDSHLLNYLKELKLTKAEEKNIYKKCSINNIRDNILGEVEITNFADRLNSKLHLFFTDNKTIDTVPPVIRHIEIEDLAQTTCGWSYNSELAAKYKEAVRLYFKTMFPEQSERDWFLAFIAHFLNGKREDEPFLMLTHDEGKPGKTTLAKLLEAVFGRYYLNNTKMVTVGGSRDYTELEDLNGKRLLMADRLEKTDTLDCDFIKNITGDWNCHIKRNDKNGRRRVDFVAQAGLVVVADENSMPKFDKRDADFLKRMVACPLRSRFVTQEEFQEITRNKAKDKDQEAHLSNVGLQNKNQMQNIHIADDSFKLQFNEWRSATLDLLLEYRNSSISIIPDSMVVLKKRVCAMFFDDTFFDWLNSNIRQSQTKNEFVSAKEIMSLIYEAEDDINHSRELKRLKTVMEEWALKNKEKGYKYKSRHVYSGGPRGKRVETKSVIMNATLDADNASASSYSS